MILVNLGDDLANPLGPIRGKQPGQVFIHEMTHVWQAAHTDFAVDYFWRGAVDKLNDSASYTYGPPGPGFSTFGLEAQASLVDEWFAGTQLMASTTVPGRPRTDEAPGAAHRMNPDDPYFHYIANNIRLREP